jgi:hypothetical protein
MPLGGAFRIPSRRGHHNPMTVPSRPSGSLVQRPGNETSFCPATCSILAMRQVSAQPHAASWQWDKCLPSHMQHLSRSPALDASRTLALDASRILTLGAPPAPDVSWTRAVHVLRTLAPMCHGIQPWICPGLVLDVSRNPAPMCHGLGPCMCYGLWAQMCYGPQAQIRRQMLGLETPNIDWRRYTIWGVNKTVSKIYSIFMICRQL